MLLLDEPTALVLSSEPTPPLEKLPDEANMILMSDEPILEPSSFIVKEEYLIDSRNELTHKVNGQMMLDDTIEVIEVCRKGGNLAYEELVNSLQDEEIIDVVDCEKIEASNLTKTAHLSFDDFMAAASLTSNDIGEKIELNIIFKISKI